MDEKALCWDFSCEYKRLRRLTNDGIVLILRLSLCQNFCQYFSIVTTHLLPTVTSSIFRLFINDIAENISHLSSLLIFWTILLYLTFFNQRCSYLFFNALYNICSVFAITLISNFQYCWEYVYIRFFVNNKLLPALLKILTKYLFF